MLLKWRTVFVGKHLMWNRDRFSLKCVVNLKIACQVIVLTLGIVFRFTPGYLLILFWRFIASMLLNQILNGDNETAMTFNKCLCPRSLPSRQSGQKGNSTGIDQNFPALYCIPHHTMDTCWRLCLCLASLASPSAASSSDNSALSSSSSSATV